MVITTGTDTLEELALLCALLHDGDAPIVLTGANRPASRPGADGPANLLDAVALAGARDAAGLGAVVVFGGEIHAATSARKVDSTGPAAFGSPVAGPLGRIVEGRVWLHARPSATALLEPASLSYRVAIVTAALGDDGRLLRAAPRDATALVLVALGAGHLPPGMLHALRAAAAVPVLITCRPSAPRCCSRTYGFEGAEPDLRAAARCACPSSRRRRPGWRCCAAWARGSTGRHGRRLAPFDARPIGAQALPVDMRNAASLAPGLWRAHGPGGLAWPAAAVAWRAGRPPLAGVPLRPGRDRPGPSRADVTPGPTRTAPSSRWSSPRYPQLGCPAPQRAPASSQPGLDDRQRRHRRGARRRLAGAQAARDLRDRRAGPQGVDLGWIQRSRRSPSRCRRRCSTATPALSLMLESGPS